ncbi:cytochrome P450 [Crepidotus variabilis]|uniref:Cytochrome P450 n=1 Tax=Crepidotus variabilis TaxID=179855 RepID=A0A9P6EUF0_9AGAR|nr:cytochrome P450 [Crepidotus variabilis]
MVDYRLASVGLLLFVYLLISSLRNGSTRKLDHIPTAGYTLPLLSYFSSIRYLLDVRKVISESMAKWPASLFKVPSVLEWIVVATQPTHIEEICKAPENVLSGMIAIEDSLQTRYTLGPHIAENPYHIPVIRTQLTRSLPLLVPEVHAELIEAFEENIPRTTEWIKLKALDSVLKVVSRASNRVFVGVPLCKNPEWNELSIQFTIDVVQTANILRFLPSFMRSSINKLISKVEIRTEKALLMLRSTIAQRRRERQEKGNDDTGRQADLLSWLMDAAKGHETEDWYLTSRMLTVQFSAIHTSSTAFTQALYYLATYPEYTGPLREEVEEVTFREGWTKAALDQMPRVDSFIKESQRLKPLLINAMERVAVQDYRFSDGTTVPVGTKLTVNLNSHTSELFFENPTTFDGFRFVQLKERRLSSGNTEKRFDMVTTGVDSLAFGHGKHACPGRYFAASELKLMLSYVVMNYDVRTVKQGVRPEDLYVVDMRVPNPTAELLFRRRKE